MINRCKNNHGGIKSIILIAISDTKFKDGNLRMKRKYGKFTRPIHKYDLTKYTEEKPLTMTIKPGR